MDIMKFIEEKLEDPDVMDKLSNSLNADKGKVKKASKLSIPTMVKALERNAQSHEGAKSLEKALDNHKDDDIEDVRRYLESVNKDEGDKVLSHMFGNKKNRVQTNIAKETGLHENQTLDIMKQLAPLLLGALGQKKKNQNIGSSGMSGFLSSILSGSDSGVMGTVTNLLDRDGDGSMIDDVSDIVGGFFKK